MSGKREIPLKDFLFDILEIANSRKPFALDVCEQIMNYKREWKSDVAPEEKIVIPVLNLALSAQSIGGLTIEQSAILSQVRKNVEEEIEKRRAELEKEKETEKQKEEKSN